MVDRYMAVRAIDRHHPSLQPVRFLLDMRRPRRTAAATACKRKWKQTNQKQRGKGNRTHASIISRRQTRRDDPAFPPPHTV